MKRIRNQEGNTSNIKRRNISLSCDNRICVKGKTIPDALSKISVPSEHRKRPDNTKNPVKIITWMQMIGSYMHRMLSKKHPKYKKCSTGQQEVSLTLTVPDIIGLQKIGTYGIYVPKSLANSFKREEYITGWICLLSLKMFYRKKEGATIEISHIGTVRTCQLLSILKEYKPKFETKDFEICCLNPWGLQQRNVKINDFPWYIIPWNLFSDIFPSYETETHSPSQNLKYSKENEEPQVFVKTEEKIIDGVKYTIRKKDASLLSKKKEEIHKPLILHNGWNTSLEPPSDCGNVHWQLSDDLKNLSQEGFTPIFAMDKTEDKKKLFITTSYHSLWKIVNKEHIIPGIPLKSHECVHSVIRNHYACKAYWDFEYNEPFCGWPESPDIIKRKLLESILNLIKRCFNEIFFVALDNSDFLILEACKSTKISFHVILSAPGLFFATFEHVKKFMRIFECFIIRILSNPYDAISFGEHAMRILILPKKNQKMSTNRPLESVTVTNPETEKTVHLSCFWDMGASDKATCFFRTPFSTNFAENRPLVISSMNEYKPDERIFHDKYSSKTLSYEEMMFLSGLPTAVYQKPEDDRDINAVGLKIKEWMLTKAANDTLMYTPEILKLNVNGIGDNLQGKIDLKGIYELLPSCFGISRCPDNTCYLTRQRREGINWTFEISRDTIGLTDLIRNAIKNIPGLGEWTEADNYNYCPLFGEMKGCKPGENVLNGIMIKVMESSWCPIKRGNHRGRRGNAKLLLKRGSGYVSISCFTSHCGKIEHKGILRGSEQLACLFRSLESIYK